MAISRRRFLYTSALAAGALAGVGGGCQTVPSIRRVANTQPGARLNIALIGCEGKGKEHRRWIGAENVVALCDVDENHLAGAARQFSGAKTYTDYRKLFEQKDVEAVVIAIPDHHHASAALRAMARGIHVYLEKPLTHSVQEARVLAEAAKKYQVATQMGNQAHADEWLRTQVDWLQQGVIGPVREAHAWSNRPIWPQGINRPSPEAAPAHLHWEEWIGPSPMRPYSPAYHPFKWRGFWDFGTGALGDMGCHIIDPIFWGLNLTAPVAVEAQSEGATEESGPLASVVKWEFPARGGQPPLTLHWHDGGRKPPQVPGLEGRNWTDNGTLLIGDKGTMFCPHGSAPRLVPEAAMKEFLTKRPERRIPKSPGHYAEFIAACKQEGPAALSNFSYAGPLTEAVLLGNIAIRAKRRLLWDSARLRITNDEEANRLVRLGYRSGWTLG